MLVLPNDWVEGSQCSPPISNDDIGQSAPRIYGVCIRGFVALEHSIHVKSHATGFAQQTPDGGSTSDRTSLRNSTSDTATPHGKTSDRDDGGWPKPEPAREQFQSRVYKNIFFQVYPFVSNGKHARQLANDAEVMLRNIVPSSNGVVNKAPTMIWIALLCARPSQSETLRLRSHRDMGNMKT